MIPIDFYWNWSMSVLCQLSVRLRHVNRLNCNLYKQASASSFSSCRRSTYATFKTLICMHIMGNCQLVQIVLYIEHSGAQRILCTSTYYMSVIYGWPFTYIIIVFLLLDNLGHVELVSTSLMLCCCVINKVFWITFHVEMWPRRSLYCRRTIFSSFPFSLWT